MAKQHGAVAAAMAGVGLWALYRWHTRPWMYTWGANAQTRADLPGDELVVSGTPSTTRAVTIAAPPEAVWPWLAQIGENHAGFYSYSILERLAGARIHNANVVNPEWQELRVGDTIWLAKRYGNRARQVVAAVEPNSHLVLMSPSDFARVQRGQKASGAWRFCLRRTDAGTRLVVRGSGGPAGQAAFDVIHFVMERRMMKGIRSRAERYPPCGIGSNTGGDLPSAELRSVSP